MLGGVLGLAALLAASPGIRSDYHYGWTISSSPTDPFANTGAPTGGVVTRYLWLVCSYVPDPSRYGTNGAQVGVEVAGVELLNTVAINGWQNAGTTDCLKLVLSGCIEHLPVAELIVRDLPGEITLAECGDLPVMFTVDCNVHDPQVWPVRWIGYSSIGDPPASGVVCGKPVSLGAESWGRIKVLYHY